MKGVNHLLEAKENEKKIQELREMRSKPAGSMTVQEQNALFPNNVDLRLKKALGKKIVDTDAQKDLDGKLEQDDLAL